MSQTAYTSAVLVTLGRHIAPKPRAFTAAQLTKWSPDELTDIDKVRQSCHLLATAGLLERLKRPRWQLTASGIVAANEAKQSAAAQGRSANLRKIRHEQPRPNGLPTRLWALLRIRRALTSDEAACILADAGDDIAAMRKSVARLLRAWHLLLPNAIQIGARRIGGFQRYVLVAELDQCPPLNAHEEACALVGATCSAAANTGASA